MGLKILRIFEKFWPEELRKKRRLHEKLWPCPKFGWLFVWQVCHFGVWSYPVFLRSFWDANTSEKNLVTKLFDTPKWPFLSSLIWMIARVTGLSSDNHLSKIHFGCDIVSGLVIFFVVIFAIQKIKITKLILIKNSLIFRKKIDGRDSFLEVVVIPRVNFF